MPSANPNVIQTHQTSVDGRAEYSGLFAWFSFCLFLAERIAQDSALFQPIVQPSATLQRL